MVILFLMFPDLGPKGEEEVQNRLKDFFCAQTHAVFACSM